MVGLQITQEGNTSKKGKGDNKKGKEVASVAADFVDSSGILGPLPRPEGPSSREVSSTPKSNEASSSGPKDDGLNAPQTIGLKKERKKGAQGRKESTPKKNTPIRHSPMKALKLWTPVKDRKSKGHEKWVSLTLQQIKDWTEMSSENRASEARRESPLPSDGLNPQLIGGSGQPA
ncbi:unnamed protein product [Linum trigynum]|uniref:Uncharacterized protein n=1 Tax=Linum trigynum TaxID=586398 RepID=A0AAV2E4G1_9ROSI